MNLRAEIRKFADAHDGRLPEELAEMFLRTCEKGDLLPLVCDEFKRNERTNVRLAEIESLRGLERRTLVSVSVALEEFADLLDKPYRIGDGHARLFGKLTAEEHRVRIEMLRMQLSGLERDIELHESAIALLEEQGVSCLDDIVAAQLVAA